MEQYQGVILWLAAQAIGILIWGVMMEMRMRNTERAMREFWDVRDDVRDMKSRLDRMGADLHDLTLSLAWMRKPAKYDEPPAPPG